MAVGSVATGPRSLENAVSAADTTPPSSAVEVSRQRAINPPRSRTARWNLLSRSRSGGASADQAPTSAASPDAHDSLLLFAPEAPDATRVAGTDTGTGTASRVRLLRVAGWLFIAVTGGAAATAAGYEAYTRGASGSILKNAEARLTIDTRPSGAEVVVDDQPQGVTPLTMTLKAGTHAIRLRRGSEVRELPLQVAAGADIAQYIEFSTVASAPSGQSSAIAVSTDPPGAQVTIDGAPHGISPVTVADLIAGPHSIGVTGATGSAERIVTTQSDATTAVVFSLPRSAAAAAPGWLTVLAPFEVSVHERDDVVGTNGISKIMLPAGRHTLDLINDRLEYRESRDVEIVPGKTAIVRVDVNAELSVNARPWADVQIDGRQVGQTPLAHVSVTIGPHQVVFRHPQFGERRVSVDIKTRGPNRLAVDLTTPASAVQSEAPK